MHLHNNLHDSPFRIKRRIAAPHTRIWTVLYAHEACLSSCFRITADIFRNESKRHFLNPLRALGSQPVIGKLRECTQPRCLIVLEFGSGCQCYCSVCCNSLWYHWEIMTANGITYRFEMCSIRFFNRCACPLSLTRLPSPLSIRWRHILWYEQSSSPLDVDAVSLLRLFRYDCAAIRSSDLFRVSNQ